MTDRYGSIRPITVVKIVIAVAIIISTCAYFYNLNGKSLDFSSSELMVVPSDSMDAGAKDFEIPTIPEDSLIMVHRLSADEKYELKYGDVITFNQDGMVKVHRIISILPSGMIITKGDANITPDLPITYDDITGKVVGVSPIVGKTVSAAKDLMDNNPALFIVGIILVIAIIFSIVELIIILKRRPDDKD